MTHLTVERIGDYADGVLPEPARRDVAAHLAACAECSARLLALESLHARAAAAPRVVEPPEDLWPAIRADIAARPTVSVARGVPRWRRAPSLAAAALLIAVASSATTLFVVRSRDGGQQRRVAAAPVDAAPVAAATPGAPTPGAPARDTSRDAGRDAGRDALVRYAALERDYDRTAAGLRAALDARRATLAPATVATVERSLRTIDDAIAEARAALARDPGNQALVDMLTASHEQRLDLLRRASQIQSGA